MPDLNELLRWSIANSTLPSSQDGQQTAAEGTQQVSSSEGGLTIRYNPPSSATHSGTSALHPSDLAPADLSPASTPGPGTPTGEIPSQTFPLPSTTPKRNDLTTEMLDLILGKSDSITMKEKMAFAVDEKNPLEERVEALDDFEMLIELIDNANNMPILKLWQPLLNLLSSPEDEIVSNALWIIGTAVQNNIKAQAALYIHSAFPLILQSYLTSSSPAVRSKAIYALSASLKHWPLASQALSQKHENVTVTGYEVLLKGLKDSDKNVRKKVSFLVSTLVLQANDKYDQKELPNEVRNVIEELTKSNTVKEEGLIDGLSRSGIFKESLDQLKDVNEDNLEFEENSLKSLINALKTSGLNDDERGQFKGIWNGLNAQQREDRGLDKDGIDSVNKMIA